MVGRMVLVHLIGVQIPVPEQIYKIPLFVVFLFYKITKDMEIKSKLIVIGLVENENHEFLVCQRYEPELPEVHLKWDLPGGTNEFGENLEDTLEREFLEETGLQVKITSFMPKTISKTWDYPNHKQHTLVLCFYCSLISGSLNLNDHKINDLKWIPKEQFVDLDFLQTTQSFIDIIMEK